MKTYKILDNDQTLLAIVEAENSEDALVEGEIMFGVGEVNAEEDSNE